MKYSVVYNKKFRYLDVVDEIILYWSTKDDIVDFSNETFQQKQRVVIDFMDCYARELREAMPTLERMKKEHSNFAVRLNVSTQKAFSTLLRDKGIPFFFGNFCSSWDSVFAYASLGVKDLYITEELGFDLKNIKIFCEPRRINVRVFPNIAQVSGQGTGDVIPAIQKFFIRPEDIPVYEEFVDICELWTSFDKQSVMYEIYKSQQWLGDLKEIITDFDLDIPNTVFLPDFPMARTSCQKKCFRTHCSICPTILDFAKILEEADLEITGKRQPVRDATPEDYEKLLELEKEEENEITDQELEEAED